MSAIMSAHPSQHLTSPALLLFARGVWSLLHIWPALRLAVSEEWGGDESKAKRIWFISTVVDEFEEKSSKAKPASTPAPAPSAPSTSSPSSSATASTIVVPPPPGIDLDSLADLLYDILLEEFDIDLEDDSPLQIARQILSLWSDASQGIATQVLALEAQEAAASKTKVVASRGAEDDDDEEDNEEDYETDSDEGDLTRRMDGMESVLEEAPPTLVERKVEPEVDEDGFTMVKKGKGARK